MYETVERQWVGRGSKNEYLGLVLLLIHFLTFQKVFSLSSGTAFSSTAQKEDV